MNGWDETVYLHLDLRPHFSSSVSIFDQLMALRGECYRRQKSRQTHRVCLGGETYFIKQYGGIGWKEIVKDLLQLRLPVLGAKNEKRAIAKLQSLGVAVPTVMGYGRQGRNPARQKSFILLEDIAPAISLETLTRTWPASPPPIGFKHRLIAHVAKTAKALHHHGINHRDFYLCHFLLKMTTSDLSELKDADIKLYLIDLHRAQIRHLTPRRWIIKDLSGLYFSSKNIGLTQRDIYRFMKSYAAKPLRELLESDNPFWQKVKKRGERLYSDHTT